MSEVRDARDPAEAIAALEQQLAKTPRALRPLDHATLAYRLGLACAESPVGNHQENLRKALACYETANSIFDARFDTVEHARVLNAAGAAQRGLGRPKRAVVLFEQAAELFAGHGRDPERAAALNNAGLVRTELGDIDAALVAFAAAAELFDQDTDEGRRGRAATLHNRGQAQAASGTREGLEAALADYDEGRATVDVEEAPYHHSLIDHSAGVAATALAAQCPDQRLRLLSEAITAFESALGAFTRVAFPWQHAVAKHNLGRALAATGELSNLRRALACYEDALALLDPRMHQDEWRQTYASMTDVEGELKRVVGVNPPLERAQHFALLVGDSDPTERTRLLRDRLPRLLALPAEARHAALFELAVASTALEPKVLREYIEAELGVLMELPNETVEAGIFARVEAHRRLSDADREQANLALDQAVGDALGLTQRILVRDHLASMGFERP